MKIVILAPSPEYASYAGARIRYGRIAPLLAQSDAELVLTDLGEFSAQQAEGDVFIFSKCHDSRALVAAAALRNRGRLVGIDLFDDYFSVNGDARLARFRNWLTQMVEMCDFALSSTEAMSSVARRYRPGLPVHVMNDPAADLRLNELPEILTAKAYQARQTRQLPVAWFGVGDNPNFPVGPHDLSAFAGALRELGRTGMDVQLRVLTNARALTAAGLAQLQSLPVATEVGEWSEAGERELLARAFVAFLPVNAQPFSIAKSLNRAVTALSGGCQLLSAGYPLYRPLDPLIYRDPQALLADLERDSLRLSPARLEQYRSAMEALASPDTEASRLVDFLRSLRPAGSAAGELVLVHGHGTSGAAHKSVQAAGGLSVASPYCTAALGFDVIFTPGLSGLDMLVSQKTKERLRPQLKNRTVMGTTVAGKSFLQVKDCERQMTGSEAATRTWGDAPLPFQLATYANSMREIRRRITEAFGPCHMIISETSPLPFTVAL
jgi:hypothetical protein